jgi:MarR family transcriptional regulator, transcriptional regulator for hemolysin
MRGSCKCWTRSARINKPGLDMSGHWRSATSIPCSFSWRLGARVRVRLLEPPARNRRRPAVIPHSYEASRRMFFEFTRGNSLGLIHESRAAFDLDERFENALRRTAAAWRQAVDRRLRHLGMSRVSWLTIAAATQACAPLSQSNLADTLAISRASMVHTIDRLVKNGLVKRESSASDRRLKRIVVTEAGARLYSLLKGEVAAVRRQMLAIVELEKLVHLTELLETLQEPLRPSSGGSLPVLSTMIC